MGTLQEDIQQLKEWDVDALSREGDFGKSGFQEAVRPAREIKELYRLVSVSLVGSLPQTYTNELRGCVNADTRAFSNIKEFDQDRAPSNRKAELISEINERHHQTFKVLAPLISFSVLQSGEFQRVEDKAKEAVEALSRKAQDVELELEARKKDADSLMAEIRAAAAAHGVSQQATYFKAEAEEHGRLATGWKYGTFLMALLIGALAGLSLYLHKAPGLKPVTELDSYQLIASKVLLFVVLSYMLILCARNFMSHKHNQVVNKHRQNALMTFKSLADAAGESKLKDAILAQAATCIFGHQETGYTKPATTGPMIGGKSVIELIQGAEKISE